MFPELVSGVFTTPVSLGIIRFCQRRGARVADRGGLENRCGLYCPPWVRIPPPPLHQSPATALLDPAAAVLRHTGPVMFLVFFFAGLVIWKLAQRKESGWYLALLTGAMMAIGAFPAHYLRPPTASLVPADTLVPSIFTSTFWMAETQGVIFNCLASDALLQGAPVRQIII